MEDIFKMINPNKNDILTTLNKDELEEFITLLDLYYISMRNSLNISNDISFGVELEFEHANRTDITKGIKENNLHSWNLKDDDTLVSVNGAEISSPILRDNIKMWQELITVCKILEPNATIGNCAGGHIHIGVQILGNNVRHWLNFIKIWAVYERVIYRFSYGEFLTPRQFMLKYADIMARDFWNIYLKTIKKGGNLEDIIYNREYKKEQGVSFAKVKCCDKYDVDNTIEFRCPNGSLNPIIWQNNINFFTKLLKYCSSNNFDDDIVQKRHKIRCAQYPKIEYYNSIYLDDAIELCDMIFDNNLDKINFLRQYTKSFEIGTTTKEVTRARTFTKNK